MQTTKTTDNITSGAIITAILGTVVAVMSNTPDIEHSPDTAEAKTTKVQQSDLPEFDETTAPVTAVAGAAVVSFDGDGEWLLTVKNGGLTSRPVTSHRLGGTTPPSPIPPQPIPPQPIPPQPIPPAPVVPSDNMGNAGQKSYEWARELGLDATQQIAKNYQEASDRLAGRLSPPLPTIDIAVAFIQQANAKVTSKNEAAWKQWATKVNALWTEHVTDRSTASEFFGYVARGLKTIDPSAPMETTEEFGKRVDEFNNWLDSTKEGKKDE